jgi:CheY-like chemotaxis protein
MEPQTQLARKVLIVDDHDDSAQVLGVLLGLDGHEIALASNGLDALEIAARFRPEVVILDLRLPGIGGLDLAVLLRKDHRGTIIIALTGLTDSGTAARCRAAGIDRHLAKPLADPDALRRLVIRGC